MAISHDRHCWTLPKRSSCGRAYDTTATRPAGAGPRPSKDPLKPAQQARARADRPPSPIRNIDAPYHTRTSRLPPRRPLCQQAPMPPGTPGRETLKIRRRENRDPRTRSLPRTPPAPAIRVRCRPPTRRPRVPYPRSSRRPPTRHPRVPCPRSSRCRRYRLHRHWRRTHRSRCHWCRRRPRSPTTTSPLTHGWPRHSPYGGKPSTSSSKAGNCQPPLTAFS